MTGTMITTIGEVEQAVTAIGGVRVLHVMAAEPEYGPELRQRIAPLCTGVGPVEAAAVVAAALATSAGAGAPIDLVISLGSAGSATTARGSIHQVSSVSWRDVDASALGIPAGITPFLGLAAEQAIPWSVPGVPSARLSTGADIVSGADAYRAIDADLVDMETWAVLRACQMADVALIGLRGVSDGADDLVAMDGWTDHLTAVDHGLARALDAVHRAVGDGLVAAARWAPH